MSDATPPTALTVDVLLKKSGARSVSEIRNLNLWGLSVPIEDISILSQCKNLEVCSLTSNAVADLRPLCNLPNLRELYLRGNRVSSFTDVALLARAPMLRVLWLSENPIANDPRYRRLVLRMMPRLEKLDQADVLRDERLPYVDPDIEAMVAHATGRAESVMPTTASVVVNQAPQRANTPLHTPISSISMGTGGKAKSLGCADTDSAVMEAISTLLPLLSRGALGKVAQKATALLSAETE
jgi:hypothetical protein